MGNYVHFFTYSLPPPPRPTTCFHLSLSLSLAVSLVPLVEFSQSVCIFVSVNIQILSLSLVRSQSPETTPHFLSLFQSCDHLSFLDSRSCNVPLSPAAHPKLHFFFPFFPQSLNRIYQLFCFSDTSTPTRIHPNDNTASDGKRRDGELLCRDTNTNTMQGQNRGK